LPSAVAARFGLKALAYRLYVRMLEELARDFTPEHAEKTSGRESDPRPLL